jgi:hypothetical protein
MARHLVPPALPSNIPAGPTQPADLSEPIVAADEHQTRLAQGALLVQIRSARVVLGRLRCTSPAAPR